MSKYTTLQNWSLLILRLMIAAIFLYGAYGKLPMWSVTPDTFGMQPGFLWNLMKFLSIAEFVGAAAVTAGFLTRTASVCHSIIMVGAIDQMMRVMGMGFVTPTGAGWEFNMLVLGASIILIAFGPGLYSVDAKMGKNW